MKYIILARRYRPQTFRDVFGQEAIITTLKNALRLNRVAHGYLFCGSRGVGKTTLARLFAKALNCEALDHFEPCNKCPSCLEILSGQSLDVIEIDGASNRGIDDIRQLNETVGYAPSHGKYKIYIIDEVHMLTKEAFNALLKTLEEPPEHAKFFFATTEPHKVLPTIISRCQRFDLQRLSEEQISKKLQLIAADQKREATADALHLIATFAEGSLRDAESLFDQILCFAEGAVSAEHVRSVLGLVPDDFLFSLDTAFAEGKLPVAFELVEKLFQMGKDLNHFGEQLIQHYRQLALMKTAQGLLRLPEPLASKLEASAKLYTQSQLFYILETLLPALAQMQKSPMQRVSLESILLQILRSKNRIPIEVLVRRLSELEQKLLEAPKNAELPPVQAVVEPLPAPVALEPPPAPKIAEPILAPVIMQPPKTTTLTESLSTMKTPLADLTRVLGSKDVFAEAPTLSAIIPQQLAPEPPTIEDWLTPPAMKPVPFNPFQQKTSKAISETEAAVALYPEKEAAPIYNHLRTPHKNASEPEAAVTPYPEKTAPSIYTHERTAVLTTPSVAVIPKSEPKPVPPPILPEPVQAPASQTYPGRHETLLRFASIELEGTLKN